MENRSDGRNRILNEAQAVSKVMCKKKKKKKKNCTDVLGNVSVRQL